MKTLATFLCLLLVGCGTPGPNGGRVAYPVQIEVNEPGAKIEVNGGYVGDAPCEITLWGGPDGRFFRDGSYYVFINAIPSQPGQFKQGKTFMVPSGVSVGDYIPKKIYFNMTLGAVNSLDINLNK